MLCSARKLETKLEDMSTVLEFAISGLREQLQICVDLLDRGRPDEARKVLLRHIEVMDIRCVTDTDR